MNSGFVNILAVISPVLLAVLGAVGYLYRRERERLDEIERQLSDKRYDTYSVLIDTFMGALHKGSKLDTSKLTKVVQESQKRLLMYGSDNVMRAFIDFMRGAYEGKGIEELARRMGTVLVEIRRDMGNKRSKITYHDIFRMLITDYDEELFTRLDRQSTEPKAHVPSI